MVVPVANLGCLQLGPARKAERTKLIRLLQALLHHDLQSTAHFPDAAFEVPKGTPVVSRTAWMCEDPACCQC